MKKCIVISDSFKGSISSIEIGRIAKSVIPEFFPDCTVVSVPAADGGEGTVSCFLEAMGGETVTETVTGPLDWPVSASYALIGYRAVIEMAAAAGLPLVGRQRNPMITTTYGVGQQIKSAVLHGAKEIILGLGGSATNDGGCGCASALGVKFYDCEGNTFIPRGGTLKDIRCIDVSDAKKLLEGIRIIAMCDIDNPLYGPNGAAYIFAPQKGADSHMVAMLDDGLNHLAEVIQSSLNIDVSNLPGSGAAGGFGAGCVAFFDAELRPGIETVLNTVGFDELLEGADLVITGEGRIDSQSLRGKVVSGVAKRAKRNGVPVIAIVGDIRDDAYGAYELGVSAIFSTNRLAIPFRDAITRSRTDYTNTLKDIMRLIRAVQS